MSVLGKLSAPTGKWVPQVPNVRGTRSRETNHVATRSRCGKMETVRDTGAAALL
jgi:hypothetical protein